MIPILFETNETAFTSNGLGRLADATRCEVTEERNGPYELVLEYPVAGKMASALQCGRYIYATHDEGKVPQAFQIYKVSTPIEGVITVNAWHISYALNTIIVAPFTAGSCAAAVAGVKTNSMNTNPFTFWTDKSVTADFETTLPMSARAILGGTQGSILDVYGKGEYEFDMYTVKLHLNRGANRGVSIRYGKNLTQLDQTLDASNVYNSCVPYWTNGESTVVSDVIITKAGQTTGRTVTMDLSGEFDEQPTLAELKAKAQTKIDASDSYTLKENLKIDFVALWQTEEYKSLASLQRIYLCDTVNIFYAKAGINVTAQCIKVVYDSLRERYVAMELGEPNTSLIQQIQQEVVGDVMAQVPSKSQMQAAIDKATELIGGGFGGYIKFNYLSDGTPSEMLVMDSPSESTAVNIIRLNQNGLGFSTDGGSTYANAWTIDGNLNASFITAGVLSGIIMQGNTIEGGSITSEGTYPNGVIGTTLIQGGSVSSHGENTGSPHEEYDGVFEASNIELKWVSDLDPDDLWSTWIEAGGIEVKDDNNGVVSMSYITPSGISTPQITTDGKIYSTGLRTKQETTSSTPSYRLLTYNDENAGEVSMSTKTVGGQTTLWRWRMVQQSTNSTTGAKLSYGEFYFLPDPDNDLTANKTYDVLTTKGYIAPTTYTFNSGYCTVNNSLIKSTSIVFAQAVYQTGSDAARGWAFTTHVNAAGQMYVYARDGSGNNPANGSTVKLAFLIIG